jgi:hypothetical protein
MPTMNKFTYRLESLVNIFAHLIGFDVYIDQDAASKGLFDFQRTDHGMDGSECWGLGLHVVVSPLRMSPQV